MTYMRILLVLTSCFGLAIFAGAAQQEDQENQHNKKKGGTQSQQAVVHPTTAPKIKGQGRYNEKVQQPTSVQHYRKGNTFSGQTNAATNLNSSKSNKFSGQTNVSGNAASTKFNKGKFSSQTNMGGNAKFQKQHFNLQTNKAVTKDKTLNFNQTFKMAASRNGKEVGESKKLVEGWEQGGRWTSRRWKRAERSNENLNSHKPPRKIPRRL